MAEELQSGVGLQISGIEWCKAEREKRWRLDDHVHLLLVAAAGSEGSFYAPCRETLVLDSTYWKGAVHAFLLSLLENLPIYKAPQDTPRCPRNGFALTELFPKCVVVSVPQHTYLASAEDGQPFPPLHQKTGRRPWSSPNAGRGGQREASAADGVSRHLEMVVNIWELRSRF
jgi:hypothetical protein